VAGALDWRQFGGRDAVVVVDHPSAMLSTFRLAAGFIDELSTSIRWYAEQYVPYPLEQAAVDFRTQDSCYGGQKTVFLVALQKAVLGKVMALLPPKRVKLRRIDGVPYALYRLYRRLAGDGAVEPAVVVHGHGPSGYVVVTKEGRIEAVRHVRLAEGFAMSLADKACQTCQFYEMHNPTERVRAAYATAATLACDGVREALTSELGVEVHALDLASSATFAGDKGGSGGGESWAETYSLAVGAAL